MPLASALAGARATGRRRRRPPPPPRAIRPMASVKGPRATSVPAHAASSTRRHVGANHTAFGAKVRTSSCSSSARRNRSRGARLNTTWSGRRRDRRPYTREPSEQARDADRSRRRDDDQHRRGAEHGRCQHRARAGTRPRRWWCSPNAPVHRPRAAAPGRSRSRRRQGSGSPRARGGSVSHAPAPAGRHRRRTRRRRSRHGARAHRETEPGRQRRRVLVGIDEDGGTPAGPRREAECDLGHAGSRQPRDDPGAGRGRTGARSIGVGWRRRPCRRRGEVAERLDEAGDGGVRAAPTASTPSATRWSRPAGSSGSNTPSTGAAALADGGDERAREPGPAMAHDEHVVRLVEREAGVEHDLSHACAAVVGQVAMEPLDPWSRARRRARSPARSRSRSRCRRARATPAAVPSDEVGSGRAGDRQLTVGDRRREQLRLRAHRPRS